MIRVKGQCNQGGRDYMEDVMEVSLIPGQEDSFFAIFDGHGGREAADFAKNHLWHKIKQQKGFYSEDKAQIVKAIKEGFVNVQKEMWKYRGKLTCGMALCKKVKRNPRFTLQESNVTFERSWSCVTGEGR